MKNGWYRISSRNVGTSSAIHGEDKPVTIRKTRTEFMMFSLCIRKLRRDLLKAGILHEGHAGTIPRRLGTFRRSISVHFRS